jgi:hypothetical protein
METVIDHPGTGNSLAGGFVGYGAAHPEHETDHALVTCADRSVQRATRDVHPQAHGVQRHERASGHCSRTPICRSGTMLAKSPCLPRCGATRARPPVRAEVLELQITVRGAHQICALGDGDDVVSTIAKALGDGGAVVLVEPQPQPTAARRRSSRRCTRWAADSRSAA